VWLITKYWQEYIDYNLWSQFIRCFKIKLQTILTLRPWSKKESYCFVCKINQSCHNHVTLPFFPFWSVFFNSEKAAIHPTKLFSQMLDLIIAFTSETRNSIHISFSSVEDNVSHFRTINWLTIIEWPMEVSTSEKTQQVNWPSSNWDWRVFAPKSHHRRAVGNDVPFKPSTIVFNDKCLIFIVGTIWITIGSGHGSIQQSNRSWWRL